MSRANVKQQLKGLRKAVTAKIVHSNLMKTNIPAGMAVAGPPLGPMLGQRGINIAAFCKDFNEKTKEIKEGIPLPCRITVNPDRSYELVIHQPPTTYFVKQAAGIQRGAMMYTKETAGKITLKHVYEIANIKHSDPPLRHLPLQEVCKLVIDSAKSCGIEVVKGDLNPEEYQKFLDERKVIVEEQLKELKEIKEAKMLRAG